jgi:hypothetical protein
MLTVDTDNQWFSATHYVHLPPLSTTSEAQVCVDTVAVRLESSSSHALEFPPFEKTTHSFIVDSQLKRVYGQLEPLQSIDFHKPIVYIKELIILQLLEQHLNYL